MKASADRIQAIKVDIGDCKRKLGMILNKADRRGSATRAEKAEIERLGKRIKELEKEKKDLEK